MIFYGLIGVAIGTLVAFIFNSVANIIYMRKHIYKMAFWFIIKSYLVNIVASVASILIFWFLVNYQIQNFLDFFLYAAIVFVFVILITCLINAVCFRKYIKPLCHKLRSKLIRKHRN